MDKEIRAEVENMGAGLYDVSIGMGKRLMSLPNEHQKFFTKQEAEKITRLINLPKKIEEMKKDCFMNPSYTAGYGGCLEAIESYIDKEDKQ